MRKWIPKDIWLGDEASLERVITASEAASASYETRLAGYNDGKKKDEDYYHYLLHTVNGVGIVSIQGDLVSGSGTSIDEYFGVVAYGEIRNAVALAAQDPQVKSILLDIDSPGGDANGISEVSNFIRQVDENHKPVYAYTGGQMLSGGMWLGASARQIYATRMASVGSIGVIAVHHDKTKMLEERGIKATVFRAGKYKALGNPYEKLSDLAKQEIQQRIDTVYGMFVQEIAEARGASYEKVDTLMAQGRTFLGADALQIGLIDDIFFFDQVLDLLIKEGNNVAHKDSGFSRIEKSVRTHDMTRKKVVLNEQAQAAIAAGAPAEQVLSEEPVVDPTPTQVQDPAPAAQAEAPAETTETVSAETPAAAPAVAEAAAPAVASAAPDALVSFLQTSLAEKDAKILAQSLELAELKQKATALESTHSALSDIARVAISRMQIGLGGTAVKNDHLTGVTLVQEYQRVEAAFAERFKVGGIAEVGEDQPDEVAVAEYSQAEQAKLNAVKFK